MSREAKLNFGLNSFRLPEEEKHVDSHAVISNDGDKWITSLLINENFESIHIVLPDEGQGLQ